MHSMYLDDLTRVISQIGFYSTSILVVTFHILTLFFLKRDFGTYRNLLISFSILGFIFSSSEYLIHPMIHSYNSGFAFFTNSQKPLFSNDVMKVGLVSFCGLYGSTVCFIAVQFLYRYWALFNVENLSYFQGWKLSIWFVYSFTVGTLWAIGIHNFLENDRYSISYLQDEVVYHYGMQLSNIPSFTSVIYCQSGEIRWWNLMCTLEMTIVLGSQYLIICFCGIRMNEEMKEKVSLLSTTRKRLHAQFFKSLVLQIVVPSIILFFPMIIIVYIPIFDLDFSFSTGIIFSAFALYPAVDIAIILYIVTDYTTILKQGIGWLKLKQANPRGNHKYLHEVSAITGGMLGPMSANPSMRIV